MSRASALMRSDAFDQQRELRMKERWGGGDLEMRVVLRMAAVMIMTAGGGNKCEEAEDDADGGGD